MINQLSTRHARISLWKVAAILLISNHEDLFPIYIASCILNQSPVLYNHSLEHCSYIHSIRKTSFPQTIKTLLVSLALSNVGVGLIVQPFYTQLCHVPGLYCNRRFFISSLFLGVVANSADTFGDSYSSQIPGACGSQTCCFGDHCMIIESIFIVVRVFARYSFRISIQSQFCRFETPWKPNSRHARRSGDTGLPQRILKVCGLYILRML